MNPAQRAFILEHLETSFAAYKGAHDAREKELAHRREMLANPELLRESYPGRHYHHSDDEWLEDNTVAMCQASLEALAELTTKCDAIRATLKLVREST